MINLRQSTASQEVPLGPFLDPADGDTAVTGLTIANTDIKVWKTGATSLANKNSGGATHISGGVYYTVLDATDTDTLGPLVIFVHVAGALAVRLECCVLDEAVYDVVFGTTAPATATNITAAAGVTLADGAITAAKIAADAITAAKIADGAIDADAIASAAFTAAKFDADCLTAAKFAADVTTEFQSGLATAAALSTVAGYLDTEVAAIKSKTDQLTFSTANRVDCQVYGMETGTVTAAALATDAGTEIADAVLVRNVSNVEASAPIYSLAGIVLMATEASYSGSTLTVKRTDGSTTFATRTLTTDEDAVPITGVS